MKRWFWVNLCRIAGALFLGLSVYRYKSILYREIFEREYKDVKITTYQTMEDLVLFIWNLKWVPDGIEALFDAFSYPGRVEVEGRRGNHAAGDCDEFAVYIAHAVANSPALPVSNPRVLTITWIKADGKAGGHNVCLLDLPDGRVAFMDYSYPVPFNNVREIVEAVVELYAGEDATVGSWGISDPFTLRPLEVHWY